MTPALGMELAERAQLVDSQLTDLLYDGTSPVGYLGTVGRSRLLPNLWASARHIAGNRNYPLSIRIYGYSFLTISVSSFAGLMVCVAALALNHVRA